MGEVKRARKGAGIPQKKENMERLKRLMNENFVGTENIKINYENGCPKRRG